MEGLLLDMDASFARKALFAGRLPQDMDKAFRAYLTTNLIMREKKGFSLRQVCGEYIMVAVGKENIDFSNVVSMNETSVFLWNTFQDKDFTEEDMAKALFDEYDVSMENAQRRSRPREAMGFGGHHRGRRRAGGCSCRRARGSSIIRSGRKAQEGGLLQASAA